MNDKGNDTVHFVAFTTETTMMTIMIAIATPMMIRIWIVACQSLRGSVIEARG